MRTTLNDVITAARAHQCPIIHISALAGEAPFIASRPCLGEASAPLVELTVDDYYRLMAEIRNAMVVEHDETLSFPIFTAGARDLQAPGERLQLPPRSTSGTLLLACGAAAVSYLMDSVGQETTIVYDGLRTFADIQTYWQQRGELRRMFIERYAPFEDDLHAFAAHLDRTVALGTFDVDAYAVQHGLRACSYSAH